MDIAKLRTEADFANGQPDGHEQPALPNWRVIGELIAERDALLADNRELIAVAKAATKVKRHLDARIKASGVTVPIFSGIAELHEALSDLSPENKERMKS